MNETPDVPDYLQLPLGRFLDLVASKEPAPAGGSVAAVAVALAAGLAGMAARFSGEHLAGAAGLAERADSLRSKAASLARADAVAYGKVLQARRADDDLLVRATLSEAADVPLSVAGIGVEVAEISARLLREGNPNLKGDADTAVLLAEAGARAAARLARINLQTAGTEDDRLSRAEELAELPSSTRHAREG